MQHTYYDCALDELASSDTIWQEVVYEGNHIENVRFISAEIFTKIQSGILYRKFINETIKADGSFDGSVGCYVSNEVNYGSGFKSCFRKIPFQPASPDEDEFNREGIQYIQYSLLGILHKGNLFQAREWSVLNNLHHIEYSSVGNRKEGIALIAKFVDNDGSFFTVRKHIDSSRCELVS